jgi:hypothetical protein
VTGADLQSPLGTLSLTYRAYMKRSLLALLPFAIVLAAHADEGQLFPKGQKLTSVVAIEMRNLDAAQRVMLSTLQGVVAKRSSKQIFMEEAGPPWKNFLTEQYGIPVTNESDPWTVVAQFATNVEGYILYDKATKKDSVNAATSLCGPYNAIAVDVSIEARVRATGITNKVMDVRSRDEQWVYDNYRGRLNPVLGVELDEDIDYHLRDYAVMANAFVFFDQGALHQHILNDWPAGGILMGYADVSVKGEYDAFVGYAQRGIYYLGCNMAANLSLLSSISDGTLRQKSHPPEPVTETNVHYVTFLMSDGDNVAFDEWSLYFHFSGSSRGKFNMGWPILASLVDYAPMVLRWHYENASVVNGKRDNFIAQGGIVGTYFNSWPADRLAAHAKKLDAFMKAADLRVLQTIGSGGFDRMDVWEHFTAQPNIDGIFYNNYGGPCTGRVLFSNGKPIVDIRGVLWKGIEDEAALAARVNSFPRNPYRAEGYTAVLVHCWSMNLDNVQAAIKAFKPDVRVVTPEEFMKLVRKNVFPFAEK